MREELMRMAAEIRTEWGIRKALNYIRIVLEEEDRHLIRQAGPDTFSSRRRQKESPREGQDQGEQRAQGV